MIEGDARISQDNGNSWTSTGTGQYLLAGDEIQLSEDGLAFIFYFNGAVIRLEGPSDYQLMLAEFNTDSRRDANHRPPLGWICPLRDQSTAYPRFDFSALCDDQFYRC